MKGACCLVPIEQDNKAVCVATSTNDGSGPVGKSRRARGAERAYSNTITNRKIGRHYYKSNLLKYLSSLAPLNSIVVAIPGDEIAKSILDRSARREARVADQFGDVGEGPPSRLRAAWATFP